MFFLFLMVVALLLLVLLLLFQLLKPFFDDLSVEPSIFVFRGVLELLAKFKRALVFFEGINPLFSLVVWVVGGFTQPEHRVSQVVKRLLL